MRKKENKGSSDFLAISVKLDLACGHRLLVARFSDKSCIDFIDFIFIICLVYYLYSINIIF